MKRRMSQLVLLPMALLLVSCAATSPGPTAWVDQPLEGAQLPMQPLTITAHASDGDGVAAFQFLVGDELIQEVSASGHRLGEASIEWTPTSGGEVRLRVIAIDANGNRGAAALVSVLILGESGEAVDIAQAQVGSVVSATIEKVECLEPPAVAITFSAFAPAGIQQYDLFSTWVAAQYTETFQAPLPTSLTETIQVDEPFSDEIDRAHQWGLMLTTAGQSQPYFTYAMEPEQRCPGHYKYELADDAPDQVDPGLVTARQNATCRAGPNPAFEPVSFLNAGDQALAVAKLDSGGWLQVRLADTQQSCWIAANLLQVDPAMIDDLPPMTEPPVPPTPIAVAPATATAPASPAPDTTPPTLALYSVDPNLILTEGNGCSSYSRTTVVGASVTDNVEVATVTAVWSVGAESGQAAMVTDGFDYYTATIGPVNTSGTLSIYVRAFDTSNNMAEIGALAVTVQNCIE